MIGFYRNIMLAGGIVAAIGGGPALGQENLDAGKSPAQLYAADCAICHKSPQGLTKGGGLFGLSSFLREHYTASREAASAIAAYLQAIDKPPAAPTKRPAVKRTAKGDEKGKPNEAKPEQMKSGEPKSAEPKSGEAKAGDGKAGESKPSDPKGTDARAVEPKAAETKPAEPKKDEQKPAAKDEQPDKKLD